MLKLYRKSDAKRVVLNAAQKKRLARELELRCRVQRPDIVAFFLGGDFFKLPALAPSTVKDRATRILDYSDAGWVIPPSNYDPARMVDEKASQSQANSVTLWISKNLADLVDADAFSVVVE